MALQPNSFPVSYISTSLNTIFKESYDFAEVNALLGGLGIVFINGPLSPKSAYRFAALLAFTWRKNRLRSAGFEVTFPSQIDYHHISYEFAPGGHKFTYEGPLEIRQIALDDFDIFNAEKSTYSFGVLSKEQATKQIYSHIASSVMSEFGIKEGVTISFRPAGVDL